MLSTYPQYRYVARETSYYFPRTPSCLDVDKLFRDVDKLYTMTGRA